MMDTINVTTDDNGWRVYEYDGETYYSRDMARLARKRSWEDN